MSNSAMLEAGTTFKKSKIDYKQASKSITQELMADMKESRDHAEKEESSKTRFQELTACSFSRLKEH
jgi:hypothetical protein